MRKWVLIVIVLLPQVVTSAAAERATARGSSASMRERTCAALVSQDVHPIFAESIGIVFGADVPPNLIRDAVARWSQCKGYRADFPRFLIGQPGTQTIEVRFDRSYRGSPRCGSFVGRTIWLYAFAIDSRGRVHFCGSRVDGLAHELGHVLGLLDAPEAAGCREYAMAAIDRNHRERRSIQPAECRAVGRRWLTPQELRADDTSIRLVSDLSAQP